MNTAPSKSRMYRVSSGASRTDRARGRSSWLARCLTVGLLGLLAACTSTAPPVQEMSDARQAISAAREAGADRLAPQVYSRSVRLLALAESTLARRRFKLAADQAKLARQLAIQAMDEADTESRRDRR